jgi:lysophospholipase L1-like esterase
VAPSGSHEEFLYVALGDSISIDLYAGGSGRGGPSLLTTNRDDDFPEWHGRDLATQHPGSRLQLLALDGGTVETVLEVELPQLAGLERPPDLVSLTVGGNDLLQAYGDTASARSVVGEVRAGVDEALGRLGDLAPGATVLVGTVYDPSDGTGNSASLGLPPWPDAVAVLAELNDALRASAAAHGARLADIHGAFAGHGLRAGDPRGAAPRPEQRDLWFCSVIEPNAWGASGVRAAFWEALNG